MKQNPPEPNAIRNIGHSFCKRMQKTDRASDKMRDPRPSERFQCVSELGRLEVFQVRKNFLKAEDSS